MRVARGDANRLSSLGLIGNSFMSRKSAIAQRFLLLAYWSLCVTSLITEESIWLTH